MVTAVREIEEITEARLPVPDGKDIIISRDDFTNDRAWERLVIGMSLDVSDFKDFNLWKRYWYIANGLTEGCICVGGPEGYGKSLWMYKTGYDMRELFGKGCTFDVPPKETFGTYRTIDDETFIEELNKFKEIARLEKAKECGEVTDEEFDKALNSVKLFNSVIGVDEAYDRLDKSRRGNFAVNMGHLVRKYRHYHNLFIFVTPDLDDIDKRMVFRRRTHEVRCFFDGIPGHPCRFNIWYRRPNRWTTHELIPSNWSKLWETHNIIGGTVLPIKGVKQNGAAS